MAQSSDSSNTFGQIEYSRILNRTWCGQYINEINKNNNLIMKFMHIICTEDD